MYGAEEAESLKFLAEDTFSTQKCEKCKKPIICWL